MSSWSSYPSIYAVGHRVVADILAGPVYVEEKIDGSQFSFGLSEDGSDLRARSKGAPLYIDAPERMFTLAIETVKRLRPRLVPGWTYRGEFLAKPKHNTLIYDRVPHQNIIIFDVSVGIEQYLSPGDKKFAARDLDLEAVPLLYEGIIGSISEFRALLDRQSILGGAKIEGVVIKPVGYDRFGADKKCLLAKFVAESFKEMHSKAWADQNPGQKDICTRISGRVATPARWAKSVQHLRERGEVENSPRDIGKLLKELQEDVERECREEILEELWAWAWPQIRRRAIHGFPEWYKEELLKSAFEATAGGAQ